METDFTVPGCTRWFVRYAIYVGWHVARVDSGEPSRSDGQYEKFATREAAEQRCREVEAEDADNP